MKYTGSSPTAIPEYAATSLCMKPPGSLRPWPGNARKHPLKQMALLKASFKEYGFTAPVLIDESDTILSGHGRVQVAIELNIALIPTRLLSGLSEAQKRAYVIADNRLAEQSLWDIDLLKSEFALMLNEDLNIELTGFSTTEVDLMFDTEAKPSDLDSGDLRAEDIPAQAVSQLGDLWILGDHRLLCADALSPQSYETLMDGAQAEMVVSDPPYNVPIAGNVCGKGKIQHKEFVMASGELTSAQFTNDFLRPACQNMHDACVQGAVAFLFMDWRHASELQAAAGSIWGPQRQLCVWVKANGGMGSFYRSQHELVYVYRKGDGPYINNFGLGEKGRYRTNVWNYAGVNSFGDSQKLLALHPTVKPVSMIADAIRDCSHRKGLILDPFAGSGTILIAAQRTGRFARALELDPHYVDVGVCRWQRVTGKQAVLASTGQTWEQVRKARQPLADVELGHVV